jgi:hypothetical protein
MNAVTIIMVTVLELYFRERVDAHRIAVRNHLIPHVPLDIRVVSDATVRWNVVGGMGFGWTRSECEH